MLSLFYYVVLCSKWMSASILFLLSSHLYMSAVYCFTNYRISHISLPLEIEQQPIIINLSQIFDTLVKTAYKIDVNMKRSKQFESCSVPNTVIQFSVTVFSVCLGELHGCPFMFKTKPSLPHFMIQVPISFNGQVKLWRDFNISLLRRMSHCCKRWPRWCQCSSTRMNSGVITRSNFI